MELLPPPKPQHVRCLECKLLAPGQVLTDIPLRRKVLRKATLTRTAGILCVAPSDFG
jgi:hypothetical protein